MNRPWVVVALHVAVLWVPAACVTGPPKSLCSDSSECTSNPGCPADPPQGGTVCKTPVGADCYYCSEGSIRIDASHYDCREDPDETDEEEKFKFKRLSNLDCE